MNRVLVHHLPDTYGTMHSWSMRVAIILPWVGGAMPPHLSFTCHTMIGGLGTATLLLFHEVTQKQSVPEACLARSNIEVKELQDGGIAALHVRRIAEATGSLSRVWNVDMQLKLERLLQIAPALLSEFKPSWGWVFGEYLYEYSHWTYTDVDIVFGRLNSESYAALISNLCQSPQA